MEIELRNVGIVRSAHLQFVQGLNLIVGASSSGKSTLFRAIRSMMDNSFIDSNISYGQRKLAIRMQYDGHSATYIRDLDNSSRKSAYQIDGKVYTKLGRTSLEDLSNLFKLAPVEIDGEKINFNFSAQFSGPFLLLGSASLLYSILTYRSSFDITKINDLYFSDFKNTKKELDALVKTKKTLEKEKDKKEDELKTLTNVPEIYTKVQILKSKNEEYIKSNGTYSLYRESLLLHEKKKHIVEFLNVVLDKYKNYNNIYDMFLTLKKFKESKKEVKKIERNIKKNVKTIQKINSLLSSFTNLSLLQRYKKCFSELEICKNKVNKYRHLDSKMSLFLINYNKNSVLNSYYNTIINNNISKNTLFNINITLGKVSLFLSGYSKLDVLNNYIVSCKSVSCLQKTVDHLSLCVNKIEGVKQEYTIVKLLSVLQNSRNRVDHNRMILNSFSIPTVQSLTLLQSYLLKIKEFELMKKEIDKKDIDIKKVLESIKSVGVCPLCNQLLCDCV